MKGTYEKKSQTTLLLKPESDPSSFKGVLENLFYKQPSLSDHAINLLKEIAKGNFESRNWKTFCKTEFPETELDRAKAKYYSVIRKLMGAGLIYKRNNLWRLHHNFENHLEHIGSTYKRWKKEQVEE